MSRSVFEDLAQEATLREVERPELVLYQPRTSQWVGGNSGTSVQPTLNETGQQAGGGTGFSWTMSTGATGSPFTTQNVVTMKVPFRGRVIGVRPILLPGNAGKVYAGVDDCFDYDPLSLTKPMLGNVADVRGAAGYGMADWLIDDQLDPRRAHVLELAMVGDPTVAGSFTFAGFVVDRRAGYSEQQRGLQRVGLFTITSSDAPVQIHDPNAGSASLGSAQALRTISKIFVKNLDTSAVARVGLQWSAAANNQAFDRRYLAVKDTTGETAMFDFGYPGIQAHPNLYLNVTSATPNVQVHVWGAY